MNKNFSYFFIFFFVIFRFIYFLVSSSLSSSVSLFSSNLLLGGELRNKNLKNNDITKLKNKKIVVRSLITTPN